MKCVNQSSSGAGDLEWEYSVHKYLCVRDAIQSRRTKNKLFSTFS